MLHKFNRLLALAAALFAGVGLYAERPVAQEPQRRTAAPTVGGDQDAIIERAVRRRTLMEARKAAAERARPAREAALAAAKAAIKTKGSVQVYKRTKEVGAAPAPLGTLDPLGTPHYMDGLIPNYANTDPLAKFVHTLPGLGSDNANELGNYIPVGVPNRAAYAGSDFYDIDLVDYTQKLHVGLPKATRLRGYKQHGTNTANAVSGGSTNYLGPVIVAKRDRPVRIRFNNLLGLGDAGNLPIPSDSTLMGAGPGPNGTTFTQNRAELHLHGGFSPWISDGTPHQWFTPAGDPTANPKGVSFRNVPDMIGGVNGVADVPGAGSATYFYTNQQSGRLMFYHDHAFGLTRLNVYMGEAAGYLLVDPVETKLINAGILPSQGATLPISEDPWSGANSLATGNSVYTYGIPLVFQDKTFVPSLDSLVLQDPTWDLAHWGQPGDLWYPHVYMPNQNPDDPSGANAMGRWDYGPWFWPPVPVANGEVPGSGDPLDGNLGLSYPGTPNPSLTPEAFMDTPVVNGTPYPTITVQPQSYRFRMLNASNDRPFSFAFYTADPLAETEVKLIEASPATAADAAIWLADKYGTVPTDPSLPVWPKDGRAGGVVDYTTIGPDIIQIGNESGFLPAPVVFRSQPTTYNYNRRDIVVLDVDKHALWLTPAERADVIVDFSAFRGKTLILYNDMLAPVPAFDVRYDYYTHPDADQTATGGAPAADPGFGPNTRTLMQFKVADVDPATGFDLAALQAAFVSTATADGAFKASHHPPIIPQTFYDQAMNTTAASDTYARIQDYQKTYARTENGDVVTMPFQPKAIQELFELDYGRMNATLGVELPFTNFNNQTTIPIGYSELPTEFLTDGSTQIWKITHNGVDTHPVHFHLFDVQIMNRVGWDGAVRFPEDNELGWKETVRMKPLEDIVVAFRPRSPRLPFTLGKSLRVLDPTKAANSLVPTTDIAAGALNQGNLGNIVQVSNNNGGALYDYGWEYVWHCHILGHEENDFMRPLILNVAATPPVEPTTFHVTAVNPTRNDLTWVDNATNEVGYIVKRRTGSNPFVEIAELVPDVRSYSDITAQSGTSYDYQIIAYNQAGSSAAVSSFDWMGSVVLNGGAAYSTTAGVATLSSSFGDNTITNMQFSWDGITYTAWEAYNTTRNLTLPQPNGSKTLRVKFRDSLGNVSPVFSDSIILDSIAPTGSVSINAGAATKALSAAATLTISATDAGSGVAQMQYSLDNVTWNAWQAYATTLPVTLLPGTGTRYVYLRFRDVAGNTSLTYIDTISVVVDPPSWTGSIILNAGAAYTNFQTTATISATQATAAVTNMSFSWNGGGSWTNWEAYNTTRTINPPAPDGNKTLSVRFRDANNNVSPTYSDSIIRDTTAPTAGSVIINGGAATTTSLDVTLTISATDAGSGVTQMRISKDGGVTWFAWENYATTRNVTLLTGLGVRTITLQFRDALGNQSGNYSDSITVQ